MTRGDPSRMNFSNFTARSCPRARNRGRFRWTRSGGKREITLASFGVAGPRAHQVEERKSDRTKLENAEYILARSRDEYFDTRRRFLSPERTGKERGEGRRDRDTRDIGRVTRIRPCASSGNSTRIEISPIEQTAGEKSKGWNLV